MNVRIRYIALILATVFLAGADGCPFDVDRILGREGSRDLDWRRADHVLGQNSLTANDTGRPADADVLTDPTGLAYAGQRIFVADAGNNRVMVWDGLPEADNRPADFVLGQPGMSDGDPGAGADGMAGPVGVAARSDGLAVADTGNHRVLVWNDLPGSGPLAADRVLGQPALDQQLPPGCVADGLAAPEAVAFTDDEILVADTDNNRILIWDRGASSGASADRVLGQADFLNCAENRGSITPDSDTLAGPSGIWSDGTRLAVADRFNNRVLLWNSMPQGDQGADVVIGQSGMEGRQTNAGGLEFGLNGPTAVYWDETRQRLFVVDSGNHRVLVYDDWPSSNRPGPDRVMGQPDANTAQINNTGDNNSVNSRSLARPEGVWANGLDILVLDGGNDRLLYHDIPEEEDDDDSGDPGST